MQATPYLHEGVEVDLVLVFKCGAEPLEGYPGECMQSQLLQSECPQLGFHLRSLGAVEIEDRGSRPRVSRRSHFG